MHSSIYSQSREFRAGWPLGIAPLGLPRIRFDERGVETERGEASEAPATERAGHRYAEPKTTAPHPDSTLEELYSRIPPEAPAKTALEGRMAAAARAANFYAFSRVGHSLFALLVSLTGGTAASWLYARRERGELPASSADA